MDTYKSKTTGVRCDSCGLPGGVSEFEKYETNYFGELPLIISNALDVDIGFLALYRYTDLNYTVLKNISDFVLRKYNTPVKEYILSRQFIRRIMMEKDTVLYHGGYE